MVIDVAEDAVRSGSPVLEDAGPPAPESFVQAARLRAAVNEELTAILDSTSFRSSRRSCEFLRYVVLVALDGRTDSLKERSIGLDLLGRDSSYDPAFDATVRVRANEVRKRLRSYYATRRLANGYRIDLRPGSYCPQFVFEQETESPTENEAREPVPLPETVAPPVSVEDTGVPAINLVAIMRPAFIGLFICALLLRQQIQSGDAYHRFWNARMQGKSALVVEGDANPAETFQSILPLVGVAVRYNLRLQTRSFNMAIPAPEDAVEIHSMGATPDALSKDNRLRYLIAKETGTLRLVDRQKENAASAHAAVLTIYPDSPSSFWIAGTDWESRNRLAEIISTVRQFPVQLNVEARSGRIVQVVWIGDGLPRLEFYSYRI